MKKLKNILIIAGIIILLLLLLGWGYILLFGTPLNNVGGWNFTELPSNNTEREVAETQPAEQVATTNQLQPLTTNPVAGYRTYEKTTTTSTEATSTVTKTFLRYTERGTGHIYEINLTSGQKERISSETFGKTVHAQFSPDGQQAVLLTESGDTTTGVWLDIESGNKETLSSEIENIHLAEDGIFYTERGGEGSTAYHLKKGGLPTPIWSIPFIDIRVFWNEGDDLVINKPASHLKGGAYSVSENGWNTVIEPKYQLNVVVGTSSQDILYSHYDTKEGMITRSLIEDEPESLLAIPEKCLYMKTRGVFWCATSLELGTRNAITDWYRGEISTSDTLWSEGRETGTAITVVSLGELAGFDIDITNISASPKEDIIFFKNKIDDSLWMYRLDI